jgi:hypothetical protein
MSKQEDLEDVSYFVLSRCCSNFRFETRWEHQFRNMQVIFCDESRCIHCKAAKVAEMVLLWPRMRLLFWKLPQEVTAL